MIIYLQYSQLISLHCWLISIDIYSNFSKNKVEKNLGRRERKLQIFNLKKIKLWPFFTTTAKTTRMVVIVQLS